MFRKLFRRRILLLLAALLCIPGWLCFVQVQHDRLSRPLIQAVKSNNAAAVRSLLFWQADPNARDVPPKPPKSFLERIKLLFHPSLSTTQPNDAPTALMLAAQNGNAAITRLLLEKGADVEARGSDGKTALLLASYCVPAELYGVSSETAHWPSEAVVKLLVEQGANVKDKDVNGYSALPYAAYWANLSTVRLLLDKGAEVQAINENNSPALHRAIEGGQREIVRLLLDRGADINSLDGFGNTPLLTACGSPYSREIVALLLDRGADIHRENRETDETPFARAAACHNLALMKYLLQRGANFAQQSGEALIKASQHGEDCDTPQATQTVQFLLQNGVDVKQYGGEALTEAAEFGESTPPCNCNPEVVQLLLEKGAFRYATKEQQDNIVFHILRSDKPILVNLLRKNGVTITAKMLRSAEPD